MNKKTIILIDDEKFITDLYGEKIQADGFNIFTANNGADGAKLIKIYKPDLILLDIIMPGGDGYSVLKEIKINEETKNIPVLVLSNLANEDDKKESLRLGASDYLVKVNYTPAQIVEKIRELLDIRF